MDNVHSRKFADSESGSDYDVLHCGDLYQEGDWDSLIIQLNTEEQQTSGVDNSDEQAWIEALRGGGEKEEEHCVTGTVLDAATASAAGDRAVRLDHRLDTTVGLDMPAQSRKSVSTAKSKCLESSRQSKTHNANSQGKSRSSHSSKASAASREDSSNHANSGFDNDNSLLRLYDDLPELSHQTTAVVHSQKVSSSPKGSGRLKQQVKCPNTALRDVPGADDDSEGDDDSDDDDHSSGSCSGSSTSGSSYSSSGSSGSDSEDNDDVQSGKSKGVPAEENATSQVSGDSEESKAVHISNKNGATLAKECESDPSSNDETSLADETDDGGSSTDESDDDPPGGDSENETNDKTSHTKSEVVDADSSDDQNSESERDDGPPGVSVDEDTCKKSETVGTIRDGDKDLESDSNDDSSNGSSESEADEVNTREISENGDASSHGDQESASESASGPPGVSSESESDEENGDTQEIDKQSADNTRVDKVTVINGEHQVSAENATHEHKNSLSESQPMDQMDHDNSEVESKTSDSENDSGETSACETDEESPGVSSEEEGKNVKEHCDVNPTRRKSASTSHSEAVQGEGSDIDCHNMNDRGVGGDSADVLLEDGREWSTSTATVNHSDVMSMEQNVTVDDTTGAEGGEQRASKKSLSSRHRPDMPMHPFMNFPFFMPFNGSHFAPGPNGIPIPVNSFSSPHGEEKDKSNKEKCKDSLKKRSARKAEENGKYDSEEESEAKYEEVRKHKRNRRRDEERQRSKGKEKRRTSHSGSRDRSSTRSRSSDHSRTRSRSRDRRKTRNHQRRRGRSDSTSPNDTSRSRSRHRDRSHRSKGRRMSTDRSRSPSCHHKRKHSPHHRGSKNQSRRDSRRSGKSRSDSRERSLSWSPIRDPKIIRYRHGRNIFGFNSHAPDREANIEKRREERRKRHAAAEKRRGKDERDRKRPRSVSQGRDSRPRNSSHKIREKRDEGQETTCTKPNGVGVDDKRGEEKTSSASIQARCNSQADVKDCSAKEQIAIALANQEKKSGDITPESQPKKKQSPIKLILKTPLPSKKSEQVKPSEQKQVVGVFGQSPADRSESNTMELKPDDVTESNSDQHQNASSTDGLLKTVDVDGAANIIQQPKDNELAEAVDHQKPIPCDTEVKCEDPEGAPQLILDYDKSLDFEECDADDKVTSDLPVCTPPESSRVQPQGSSMSHTASDRARAHSPGHKSKYPNNQGRRQSDERDGRKRRSEAEGRAEDGPKRRRSKEEPGLTNKGRDSRRDSAREMGRDRKTSSHQNGTRDRDRDRRAAAPRDRSKENREDVSRDRQGRRLESRHSDRKHRESSRNGHHQKYPPRTPGSAHNMHPYGPPILPPGEQLCPPGDGHYPPMLSSRGIHPINRNSAGYCFVEFPEGETAHRAMLRLNGKIVPGSRPPKRFKLNIASYGKEHLSTPEYSLFVGDLTEDVDDLLLYSHFAKKYKACRAAKVVLDNDGKSRGYGFVRFTDESEQQQAMTDMQNYVGIGRKPIRVSLATPKKANSTSQPAYSGSASHQHHQQQQHQSYAPQSGYYGGQYGYGYWQQPGYGDYSSYYQYPPMPESSYPDPQSSSTEKENYEQEQPVTSTTAYDEENDEALEDPCLEIDVAQANKEFMEQSEELYTALEGSRWHPLDNVMSPICVVPTARSASQAEVAN